MVDDYGPLSVSEDSIQHVGVYGKLGLDSFQTTGYIHTTATETTPDVDLIHDGIPVMPGWSEIDSFPSSGTIKIDDSTYTYTSKTYSGGTISTGPYQPRKTQKYTEGTAVDITLLYYTASNTTYQNKLLASDNGHVWLINDDPYGVFQITEEGSVLLRSRHFGTHVTGNYLGLDNRVYITRGLGGVALVENSGRHYNGSFVTLESGKRLVLHGFGATGGETHSSIASLVESTCAVGGVTAQFSDYQPGSVAFSSGSYTSIRGSTHISSHGYELHFTLPQLTYPNWAGIYTNAQFKLMNTSGVQVSGRTIAFAHNGTSIGVYAYDLSNNPIEGVSIGTVEAKQIRIIFNGNMCTVYSGGAWMHTFFFSEVVYPRNGTSVSVTGSYSGSITDVRLVELHKTREAVYIEMNANIQSGLSNIIQERPVLVIPKADGSLHFTYRSNLMPRHMPIKYSLYSNMIRSHSRTSTSKSNACSDAILYYEDVNATIDQNYAAEEGFVTRILSLPNIEKDEIVSIAKLIMRANREAEVTHSITMRPDLRIEPGDIVDFTYTLSSTGTEYSSGDILVESISIDSKSNQMQINGRQLIA